MSQKFCFLAIPDSEAWLSATPCFAHERLERLGLLLAEAQECVAMLDAQAAVAESAEDGLRLREVELYLDHRCVRLAGSLLALLRLMDWAVFAAGAAGVITILDFIS